MNPDEAGGMRKTSQRVKTMFATRNKCIATRSKGLTIYSSNKKLLETISY